MVLCVFPLLPDRRSNATARRRKYPVIIEYAICGWRYVFYPRQVPANRRTALCCHPAWLVGAALCGLVGRHGTDLYPLGGCLQDDHVLDG